MIFIGIDPSITSTAVVAIETDAEMTNILKVRWYARFKTKAALNKTLKRPGIMSLSDLTPHTAFAPDVEAVVGAQTPVAEHHLRFGRYRDSVAGILTFIDNASMGINRKTELYIAIEDYAIKANGRVYDIGEYGGMIREMIDRMIPCAGFREHDPLTVKLYGSNSGGSGKPEMIAAYEKFRLEQPMNCPDWSWIEEKGSVLSDLVDAYFLARLALTEAKLRHGRIQAHQLPGRQIEVFNRVTKSYPVNILARPFLGQVEQ